MKFKRFVVTLKPDNVESWLNDNVPNNYNVIFYDEKFVYNNTVKLTVVLFKQLNIEPKKRKSFFS